MRGQRAGPLDAGIARHPDQGLRTQRLPGGLHVAVIGPQMDGIDAQLCGQLPVVVDDQQGLMCRAEGAQRQQLAAPECGTGVLKDGMLNVQAAAGVVFDSLPENEWQETEVKARAVLRAAEMVESGLANG